jgi:acyl dehydratase
VMSNVHSLWVDTVTPGCVFQGVLVEELGRAHIAQYAGAAGDFNSVHVDDEFARTKAGRPGVIAHGMLTMGLVGTFVQSIVAEGSVRNFGGRFLAPLSPGDTVTCSATVDAIVDLGAIRTMSMTLEAATAAGVVFRGNAVADRAPGDYQPPNDKPPLTLTV